MKAIVIYTHDRDIHPNYPNFSELDLTLESLLQLKETVNEELIITDLKKLGYWEDLLTETDIEESFGEYSDEYKIFKICEQVGITDSEQWVIIEIYNGYRF